VFETCKPNNDWKDKRHETLVAKGVKRSAQGSILYSRPHAWIRFIPFGKSAVFAAFLLMGCGSLNERGFQFPRGTPILHEQLPDDLRNKLHLPGDASVDRFGDNPNKSSYRIEYRDGTVTMIGPDGELHGVLM